MATTMKKVDYPIVGDFLNSVSYADYRKLTLRLILLSSNVSMTYLISDLWYH